MNFYRKKSINQSALEPRDIMINQIQSWWEPSKITNNHLSKALLLPLLLGSSQMTLAEDYCDSKSRTTFHESIDYVRVDGKTTSVHPDVGNWEYYNSDVTLIKGESVPVSIAPYYRLTMYKEYYGIWLDSNRNGSFEDNERLFNNSGSSVVSGNITVPSNAQTGETRMRVVQDFDSGISVCGTYNFGQTIDLSITIAGGNNTPPVIETREFVLPEQRGYVGQVNASDADGDTLSYSVSGSDFVIDNDGRLFFAIDSDYETRSLYFVTITVNDGQGGVTSKNIYVSLTNINEDDADHEPRVFVSGVYNENAPGAFVGSGIFDMRIGDKITYSDNNTGYSLIMQDDGNLVLVNASDYSNPLWSSKTDTSNRLAMDYTNGNNPFNQPCGSDDPEYSQHNEEMCAQGVSVHVDKSGLSVRNHDASTIWQPDLGDLFPLAEGVNGNGPQQPVAPEGFYLRIGNTNDTDMSNSYNMSNTPDYEVQLINIATGHIRWGSARGLKVPRKQVYALVGPGKHTDGYIDEKFAQRGTLNARLYPNSPNKDQLCGPYCISWSDRDEIKVTAKGYERWIWSGNYMGKGTKTKVDSDYSLCNDDHCNMMLEFVSPGYVQLTNIDNGASTCVDHCSNAPNALQNQSTQSASWGWASKTAKWVKAGWHHAKDWGEQEVNQFEKVAEHVGHTVAHDFMAALDTMDKDIKSTLGDLDTLLGDGGFFEEAYNGAESKVKKLIAEMKQSAAMVKQFTHFIAHMNDPANQQVVLQGMTPVWEEAHDEPFIHALMGNEGNLGNNNGNNYSDPNGYNVNDMHGLSGAMLADDRTVNACRTNGIPDLMCLFLSTANRGGPRFDWAAELPLNISPNELVFAGVEDYVPSKQFNQLQARVFVTHPRQKSYFTDSNETRCKYSSYDRVKVGNEYLADGSDCNYKYIEIRLRLLDYAGWVLETPDGFNDNWGFGLALVPGAIGVHDIKIPLVQVNASQGASGGWEEQTVEYVSTTGAVLEVDYSAPGGNQDAFKQSAREAASKMRQAVENWAVRFGEIMDDVGTGLPPFWLGNTSPLKDNMASKFVQTMKATQGVDLEECFTNRDASKCPIHYEFPHVVHEDSDTDPSLTIDAALNRLTGGNVASPDTSHMGLIYAVMHSLSDAAQQAMYHFMEYSTHTYVAPSGNNPAQLTPAQASDYISFSGNNVILKVPGEDSSYWLTLNKNDFTSAEYNTLSGGGSVRDRVKALVSTLYNTDGQGFENGLGTDSLLLAANTEIKIEAEDSDTNQFVFNDASASNSKTVDWNKSGYMNFQVTVAQAGEYPVKIGYALKRNSRWLYIEANGAGRNRLDFPATGNWRTYQEVSTTVELNQGANTISLKKHNRFGPNIDYISVEIPDNPCGNDCSPSTGGSVVDLFADFVMVFSVISGNKSYEAGVGGGLYFKYSSSDGNNAGYIAGAVAAEFVGGIAGDAVLAIGTGAAAVLSDGAALVAFATESTTAANVANILGASVGDAAYLGILVAAGKRDVVDFGAEWFAWIAQLYYANELGSGSTNAGITDIVGNWIREPSGQNFTLKARLRMQMNWGYGKYCAGAQNCKTYGGAEGY